MLFVLCLDHLVLGQVLQLELVDDLLGALHVGLIFLRGRVILYLLDMDVFALDLLYALTLLRLVIPVLVELREARADIVHE